MYTLHNLQFRVNLLKYLFFFCRGENSQNHFFQLSENLACITIICSYLTVYRRPEILLSTYSLVPLMFFPAQPSPAFPRLREPPFTSRFVQCRPSQIAPTRGSVWILSFCACLYPQHNDLQFPHNPENDRIRGPFQTDFSVRVR